MMKNHLQKLAILGVSLMTSYVAQGFEIDLNDHFAQATKNKDGIMQYYDQDTNQVFTYVPLMETLQDKQQVMEAYAQAQEFARQLVIDWAAKSYTASDASKFTPETLTKAKAWDARIRSGEVNSDNINSILANSHVSVSEMLNDLTIWQSDKLDLKMQEDAFIKLRSGTYAITKSEAWLDVVVPTAAFAYISFKMPNVIINNAAKIPKIGAVLGELLDGSATWTISVKPWKVTVLNVGSKDGQLVEKISTHMEVANQFWLGADSKGKLIPWDGKVRVGTGVYFGAVDNLQTLSGLFAGGTVDNVFSKTNSYTGAYVKSGIILGLGATAGAPRIQNEYLMFGWQKHVSETVAASPDLVPQFNLGYIVPIDAIFSYLYKLMNSGVNPLAPVEALLGITPLATTPAPANANIKPPGGPAATSHVPPHPSTTQTPGTPGSAVQAPDATPVQDPAQPTVKSPDQPAPQTPVQTPAHSANTPTLLQGPAVLSPLPAKPDQQPLPVIKPPVVTGSTS